MILQLGLGAVVFHQPLRQRSLSRVPVESVVTACPAHKDQQYFKPTPLHSQGLLHGEEDHSASTQRRGITKGKPVSGLDYLLPCRGFCPASSPTTRCPLGRAPCDTHVSAGQRKKYYSAIGAKSPGRQNTANRSAEHPQASLALSVLLCPMSFSWAFV